MKNFEEIKTTLDGLNKVEIPKKCSFCNCSNEEMSKFKGKYLCYNCYKELFERIHIKI